MGRFVGEALGPFSFREVRLRRPDRTFRGELALEVGGREVRLIEVGPAHTPGDLIVHVPDTRVVFAGDILFIGVTPVMWAGPVLDPDSAAYPVIRSFLVSDELPSSDARRSTFKPDKATVERALRAGGVPFPHLVWALNTLTRAVYADDGAPAADDW